MADLSATYATMPSLLTKPIQDGEVVPKRIDLQVRDAESIDAISRRMLNVEFDIGEMAIATYIKAHDAGVPMVALPIFTSGRRFLQPGFQLAARTGIKVLAELRGRSVGTAQYWLSSSIWQRQILRQKYDVDAEDLTWITFQPERMEGLGAPRGVNQRLDASGRSPQELAASGEIDAVLSPGGGPQPKPGDANPLVPAFPNRFEAQRAYSQQTGLFPIMHVTVMSQRLAEEQPWVVESLFDAYQEAKKLARSRQGPTKSEQPTSGEVTEEMVQLMGDDPWPYGIGPNRKALEALAEGAYDQELVGRRYQVEELFAPNLPEGLR